MFKKKCKLQGITGKDDKTAFACYFAWGHGVVNSGASCPRYFIPEQCYLPIIRDELIKHIYMDITSCIKHRDQQYMYQLKTVFGVIPFLFKLIFFNSHILQQLNDKLIIVIIVFYLGFGSNTSVFIFIY